MKVTYKMLDKQLRSMERLFSLMPKIKDEKSFRSGMLKGNTMFKFEKDSFKYAGKNYFAKQAYLISYNYLLH